MIAHLIERDPVLDTVAEGFKANSGEPFEVAVQSLLIVSSSEIALVSVLQCLGEVPVEQRDIRRYPRCQQCVDLAGQQRPNAGLKVLQIWNTTGSLRC